MSRKRTHVPGLRRDEYIVTVLVGEAHGPEAYDGEGFALSCACIACVGETLAEINPNAPAGWERFMPESDGEHSHPFPGLPAAKGFYEERVNSARAAVRFLDELDRNWHVHADETAEPEWPLAVVVHRNGDRVPLDQLAVSS